MKHDVYVASPLFCIEDHAQLDVIESTLTRLGFSFFSPRRDSNVAGDLRSAKTPEEKDEIAQRIVDLNINAIRSSKFLLANTKGTRFDNAVYADQGTCYEIGYANALGIPIITFNWDKFDVNIMFSQIIVHHFNDLREHPEKLDYLSVMKDDLLNYQEKLEFLDNKDMYSKALRKKYFKLLEENLV